MVRSRIVEEFLGSLFSFYRCAGGGLKNRRGRTKRAKYPFLLFIVCGRWMYCVGKKGRGTASWGISSECLGVWVFGWLVEINPMGLNLVRPKACD